MKPITKFTSRKSIQGTTLLELLIAIAIVGIIAGLAIPAFDNQIKDSRLVATTNLVIGAFNYARAEAINRGVQVQVVSSSQGWKVEEVASGEDLKLFEPDTSGIAWTFTNFTGVYDPSGYRPFGTAETKIKMCDDRDKGREVTINTSGSTSVNKAPSCP